MLPARARIVLLLLPLASAGCHAPSQYISPRIMGRVVDEATQQPLRGVRVQRSSNAPAPSEPPKGGEKLLLTPPTVTDEDGTFTVASRRDLSFLRELPLYPVPLTFTHPGYERLTKTFLPEKATNTASGEPLLPIGDIPLKREPENAPKSSTN